MQRPLGAQHRALTAAGKGGVLVEVQRDREQRQDLKVARVPLRACGAWRHEVRVHVPTPAKPALPARVRLAAPTLKVRSRGLPGTMTFCWSLRPWEVARCDASGLPLPLRGAPARPTEAQAAVARHSAAMACVTASSDSRARLCGAAVQWKGGGGSSCERHAQKSML